MLRKTAGKWAEGAGAGAGLADCWIGLETGDSALRQHITTLNENHASGTMHDRHH